MVTVDIPGKKKKKSLATVNDDVGLTIVHSANGHMSDKKSTISHLNICSATASGSICITCNTMYNRDIVHKEASL